MKISVIVPTHNRSDLIPAQVDCLRRQLDDGDELIYVDDASVDESVRILKELSVTVVALDRNGGVGRARNMGARAAKGEILVFFDDDILPVETYLQHVRETFFQTDRQIAQGPHLIEPLQDSNWQCRVEAIVWRGDMEYVQVVRGLSQTLHSQAFAIRADLYRRCGGFSEEFPGAGCEEFELAARLLQTVSIHFDRQLLSRHRFERIVNRLKTLWRRSRRWAHIAGTHKSWTWSQFRTVLRIGVAAATILSPLGLVVWPDAWVVTLALLGVFAFLERQTLLVGARHGRPDLGMMAVGVKLVQYFVIFLGMIRGVVA